MKLTGGEAVVRILQEEHVTHLFGLIGSAGLEILDALYHAEGIKFVGVRDERAAVHMADGYARASGRAGAALAGQNGPGATNLVTGIAQAYAAFSPVVALAGAVSTQHVYRDSFQEVDQQALFAPITKRTMTVPRTGRIPDLLQGAFRLALAPRCGPVMVNLPRDLLAESAEFTDFEKPERYRPLTPSFGDPDGIAAAARILASAERPLIIAGGGVKRSRAHDATLRLAELLGCPITMSPGHGDAIPFEHPLNAGQVGPRGNPVASALAREADVILALGTRLGFNTTFYSYDNLNPQAKIIHVEQDPSAIARYFPVTVGILGDAGRVASQLATEVMHEGHHALTSGWVEDFSRRRSEYLSLLENEPVVSGKPIQPSTLFKTLCAVLPKDSMITLDAGTLCLQATDKLRYYKPPALFAPLDFGLVGFSYACGLGVKAACPDRTVVSLMGDGGFGMTICEIGTAISAELNTVAIVMNNRCWGAEKAYQRDFFEARYIGADILSPPYDKVAELFGACGFRATRSEEIEEAVLRALECGRPAVVEVEVDPNALYSFRRDSFQHRQGTSDRKP